MPASRYTWLTYGTAGAERASIAAGLKRLGVHPGERVGLYSVNCASWMLVEGAITRLACVSVPLYDTLGPKVVEYISNHAELVAVACHPAVLSTLVDSLPACPTVKLVVVFSPPDVPLPQLPGVKVRPRNVLPRSFLTLHIIRLCPSKPSVRLGAPRQSRRTFRRLRI